MVNVTLVRYEEHSPVLTSQLSLLANSCIMNMLIGNALRCVFGEKVKNMWSVQCKLLNQRRKILNVTA